MLDISDDLKQIYMNDSIPTVSELAYKRLDLFFPSLGLTISNNQIVSDSFSLDESLCSDQDLTFGSCESSQLKITVADVTAELKGQLMIVTQVVNNLYTVPYGTYIVESAKKQDDLRFKDIIAYDLMKKFDVDVIDWYNALTFPLPLKTFRESLCIRCGVEFEDSDFKNDSMSVYKTIDANELIGRKVLIDCEELNGSFGHMGRDGRLKHIVLPPTYGLYPHITLYPSPDLYPVSETDTSYVEGSEDISISKTMYQSVRFEEYTVKEIDKLQIRQEEGDIGAIVGTGTNAYIIEGNFLVFGKSAVELEEIANNVFAYMVKRPMRPFESESIGMPFVEVGDSVSFATDDTIMSFIMQRTLTGIQALRDSYRATGSESRQQVTSVNKEIIQLKGKSAVLKRTVEELASTLTDVEQGLSSEISQTAEQITAEVTRATTQEGILSSAITITADSVSAKVSKGEVSSELSVESGQITLSSNRLVVNSTKFKLDGNGNAEFSGDIKGGTINISDKFKVDANGNVEIPAGSKINLSNGSVTIGAGISLAPSVAGTVTLVDVLSYNGLLQTSHAEDGFTIYYNNAGVGEFGYDTSLARSFLNVDKINSGDPITTENKNSYLYLPATHYQDSTTINPVTTTGGNVGLNGLNVASVNWCNETFEPLASSDFRLKYDIKPIGKAREFILGIKTKLFRYKDKTETQKQHSGVLEQELVSLMDRVGIDASDSSLVESYMPREYKEEGMYGETLYRVNYKELIPYCIEVIQEQDKELQSVKMELAELKALLIEKGVIKDGV